MRPSHMAGLSGRPTKMGGKCEFAAIAHRPCIFVESGHSGDLGIPDFVAPPHVGSEPKAIDRPATTDD